MVNIHIAQYAPVMVKNWLVQWADSYSRIWIYTRLWLKQNCRTQLKKSELRLRRESSSVWLKLFRLLIRITTYRKQVLTSFASLSISFRFAFNKIRITFRFLKFYCLKHSFCFAKHRFTSGLLVILFKNISKLNPFQMKRYMHSFNMI